MLASGNKTRKFFVNLILVAVILVGGAMFVGRTLHWDRPAASPESFISEPTTPLAPPSEIPLPPPAPIIVPQAMPVKMTVQAQKGMLVDNVTVDQNLLHEVGGAVRPGRDPGIFLKEGVSTLPGTGQGTAIIGGHALAKADPPEVFEPLMRLAPEELNDQSVVILVMPGGERLIYVIKEIVLVNKIDLPTQNRLANNDPNRLLLITCNLENGRNSYQNRIVVAYLSSTVGPDGPT
jgi:hypothetical protein